MVCRLTTAIGGRTIGRALNELMKAGRSQHPADAISSPGYLGALHNHDCRTLQQGSARPLLAGPGGPASRSEETWKEALPAKLLPPVSRCSRSGAPDPQARATEEQRAETRRSAPGLEFPRYFTLPGVDPFDEVEWEVRSAVIGNEKGKVVFEQRDVEIPKFWSQQATNIVVSKYFRGQIGTPERERSVKQLIGRVVDTITRWAQGAELLRQRRRAGSRSATS